MSHERQGAAYDPHAVGHEKVGRGLPPPDINKIIGRAVAQRCSEKATEFQDKFTRITKRPHFTSQKAHNLREASTVMLKESEDIGAAVVKALGEAGYKIVHPAKIMREQRLRREREEEEDR